jgi:Putative antitoxin of bacterial toxin-antitoxin system, YdaS/YdaT
MPGHDLTQMWRLRETEYREKKQARQFIPAASWRSGQLQFGQQGSKCAFLVQPRGMMTRSERVVARIREEFRVADLAKELGITAPAIYAWTRIPESRVAAVSKLTRIPRHELRPDLFKQRSQKSG